MPLKWISRRCAAAPAARRLALCLLQFLAPDDANADRHWLSQRLNLTWNSW